MLNSRAVQRVWHAGLVLWQNIGDDFVPVSVLKMKPPTMASLLDWTLPQTKPVLTPALAYLMTNVLSDESPGRLSALETGDPLV